MTPCKRRCWDCGSVAMHEDNITPFVLCKTCGSQDTRLVPDVLAAPEAVTADEPTCPRCGLVHEMPKWVSLYHRFDCDCGWRFEAEKKQVIVSRPL